MLLFGFWFRGLVAGASSGAADRSVSGHARSRLRVFIVLLCWVVVLGAALTSSPRITNCRPDQNRWEGDVVESLIPCDPGFISRRTHSMCLSVCKSLSVWVFRLGQDRRGPAIAVTVRGNLAYIHVDEPGSVLVSSRRGDARRAVRNVRHPAVVGVPTLAPSNDVSCCETLGDFASPASRPRS